MTKNEYKGDTMYENPKFNSNNEKILCEMNGKNADMLMNIKTKVLKAGESATICDENNETAILLLSGDVEYSFDGKTENAKRENQFVDRPYCVHFSKNNEVTVTANADSRILVQQTDNENDFGYANLYNNWGLTYQELGNYAKAKETFEGNKNVTEMIDDIMDIRQIH